MYICPPASVCVWLPAHPNVWTSWRAASRTAARSSWADCIIGGKATTLTWAYNGIVVRQGSRFLGLPKAITHSFFPDPPIFDFPTDQKNILQFRLIREGFDIKDMKNLHLALRSGNERRFQFEVTPHIILSWRNSDIGMWATWDLSMFISCPKLSMFISCPKKWSTNLHQHLSFFHWDSTFLALSNSPWPPSYFCNFLGNFSKFWENFAILTITCSRYMLSFLFISHLWAFQLYHFSGSRVQFSRQVGVGGIYRYLGDIRDITERGRPHLQSLTVTSLKSSGSWGLYLPFSLNFPFSLYFPCSSLHLPLAFNFPLSLCFPFSLYLSPSSDFLLFSILCFCWCWY